MRRGLAVLLLVGLSSIPKAANADLIGDLVGVIVDGGNSYNWQKVEVAGAVCGNGSQYKFFIHRTGSPHLLMLFEGGGACWDYDTCSGRAGVLGAANPNGIADDYMTQFTAKYVSPIVNGADPGIPLRARTDLPTKGWNVAYLPYCTGDVHIGNNTVTYTDPTGAQPPLTWRHNGYNNTIKAATYLRGAFPSINKLLVTGFSAGGTASSAAYYFVRNNLFPAKGYLLNDSGPIFLAPNVTFNSRALHDKIRQSWNLDSVFAILPSSFDRNDFGSITRMVAQAFPGDSIAYTGYTRDFNYSRFSYERFKSPNDENAIHAYWLTDQNAFVNELNRYANTSYFIAHHRPINDSHCSTIITFIGSHACQQMLKKKYWWEYLVPPWSQTYKCYSEFVPMEVFLKRFLIDNQRIRIYEPANWYNNEDPGMQIVAPLINGALGG